jgi:hypothetical protein
MRLQHALSCLTIISLMTLSTSHVVGAELYPISTPPRALKLNPFYKKYTHAHGYPIVASSKVNDYALKEAAYLVDLMLAHRPDVRRVMIQGGSRLVVMAHNEYSTDVPEHSHLKPKAFWDRRARGLGGSIDDPVCSCGEENLLAYKGDPYHAESILIHEFAHNIHLRGMIRVDKTFDPRVRKAYKAAMAKGLWKGKYASVNKNEYFAEGVQSWFDNNRPPDHDHNHVDTRKELKAYDPGLAALCEEVFGKTTLVYTKPTTRLKGHLAGYDPSKSPQFAWPKGSENIAKEIRAKAESRAKDKAKPKPKAKRLTVKKAEHEKRTIEGWTILVDKTLLTGEHKPLGDKALKTLETKLRQVIEIVPADRVKQLQTFRIFFDRNHELGAMQYHPGAGWLKGNGYDPAMTKAVHIPRADFFLHEIKANRQPWVVLHELSHAYHDQVLTYQHKGIKSAYERLKAAGKFDKVLHIHGRMTTHYAKTNRMEFFAEMTESYLGVNDFYPFVNAEVRQFDPELYKLLKEIWGR